MKLTELIPHADSDDEDRTAAIATAKSIASSSGLKVGCKYGHTC